MAASRQAGSQKSTRASIRRAEILSAATRLFLEKGYDATSLQDIADAVGLLKGSLFYYISGKEDLLYAVLQGMLSSSQADIVELSALDLDPLVKVRRIAEAHVRYVLANRDQATIFFRDFRSLSKDRGKEIAAERDSYAKRFTAVLSEAQQDGAICPDIDIRLASGSLLGMLNMVHEWYPHADERHVDRLASEIGDLVVASLRCDRETHRPGHRRSDGQA
ncbi:TetR/AcrR family transcriptional regulator [Mycolicibacterium goodii]|uniref:TetR/AcrR family transcriptional regulator n=1 Tax=Mycolicibacterium goodii TaxID=134601 RepID=UPI00067377F4